MAWNDEQTVQRMEKLYAFENKLNGIALRAGIPAICLMAAAACYLGFFY